MNWVNKIVRYLFLIKEIISRQGALHFQRYRVIETPWFNIYLHRISASDREKDPHDHPFSFWSFILSGSYREWFCLPPSFIAVHYGTYKAGDWVHHTAEDVHQLTILTPVVWTLVFTSGRNRYWGYRLVNQFDKAWVGHKEYRQIKNEGR